MITFSKKVEYISILFIIITIYYLFIIYLLFIIDY